MKASQLGTSAAVISGESGPETSANLLLGILDYFSFQDSDDQNYQSSVNPPPAIALVSHNPQDTYTDGVLGQAVAGDTGYKVYDKNGQSFFAFTSSFSSSCICFCPSNNNNQTPGFIMGKSDGTTPGIYSQWGVSYAFDGPETATFFMVQDDQGTLKKVVVPFDSSVHHFILVTFDQLSGVMSFYLDGELAGTETGVVLYAPAEPQGEDTTCVGDDNSNNFICADGWFQAWGLWTRALNILEAALLYNNGAGLDYPF